MTHHLLGSGDGGGGNRRPLCFEPQADWDESKIERIRRNRGRFPLADPASRAVRCTSRDDVMHELAVTESILEITLRHAAQAGAVKVTDIHLVIGALASIVDDSVAFYWDMISKDTLAEGAELHFRRIEALMECQDCTVRYKPGDGQLRCPECDGGQVRVIAGEEFRLEAIEVDSDEPMDGDQT